MKATFSNNTVLDGDVLDAVINSKLDATGSSTWNNGVDAGIRFGIQFTWGEQTQIGAGGLPAEFCYGLQLAATTTTSYAKVILSLAGQFNTAAADMRGAKAYSANVTSTTPANPTTTVTVDRVLPFASAGSPPAPVSATNTKAVLINGNTYLVTAVTQTAGQEGGTLTFSAAVPVADATNNVTVTPANAHTIWLSEAGGTALPGDVAFNSGGTARQYYDATAAALVLAVADTDTVRIASRGSFDLPAGPTSTRPTAARAGSTRWNTDLQAQEIYTGSGWAKVALSSTATAPGPAQNLIAGTPSTTAIPLSWTAPVIGDAPFTYQLEYRTSGTSSWLPWGSSGTSTSATVSGLIAANSYDFHVIASNTVGTSTSGTVSATTASIAPAAPTNLASGGQTSTSVSLSWTAPASGTAPFHYQVQYRQTGGNGTWLNSGGLIDATAGVASGLAPATSYDFQVIAQNAGGSTPSGLITVSTAAAATTAPGAPTGLSVTNDSGSAITIAWTAPATGTTPFTYQLQWRDFNAGGAFNNAGGQVTTTSATLTGTTSGTPYEFVVIAYNSAGSATSSSLIYTAASGTTTGDGVSGSQSTGTTEPIISGPLYGNITTGAVLSVSGVTITDSSASTNPGTCMLNLSCGSGTLSASVGGVAVSGSGTNSIAYTNSFANCQAAVASLVYTAPANAGSDTLQVNLWDQSGANNTLKITVTAHLPAATGGGGGTGSTSNPGDPTGTTAFRIADMMERFGVNTFSQYSLQYSNPWGAGTDYTASTVITAINQIIGSSGMTMNVREYHYAGMETGNNSNQSAWCPAVAGGTGAKFTMCPGQGGTDTDVPSMITLARQSSSGSSPWLSWLEGINEPNGVSYISSAGDQTAQQDIWNNGHTLPGISVMGPSVVIGAPYPEGYISGYLSSSDKVAMANSCSIINVHYYPSQLMALDNGSGRGGEIGDVFQGERLGFGVNYPEIITEWHPTYYNSNTALRFNDSYNGYYAPMFILEAFRLGFLGYFWFALFDFQSTQCGMFSQSGAPTVLTMRAAAKSIQAMYQLAGKAGSTKHTFTPGNLDFTPTGLQAPINAASPNTGGQTMLFQNDAGQFLLYVWNAQSAPGGTPAVVTIHFNSHTMAKVVEYNITNNGSNMTPVQTLNNASSVTLNLDASAHLLVITY